MRCSPRCGVFMMLATVGMATEFAALPLTPPALAATDIAAPRAKSGASLDKETAQKGREMMSRAIAWLRTQQDEKTGGWGINPDPSAPQFPAITALVVNGMLLDPRVTREDPAVARAIAFILKNQQPDGGIYDRQLASYNTAICISALSRVGTDEAQGAVEKAVKFLRTLQWGDEAREGNPEVGNVGPAHAFFGGVGYGRSGRPDNSNLNFFLQALEDAGVDCKDPAVSRAMVFLSRTQMMDDVNDMPYADGSKQGGFIYATSLDKDHVGSGESKGGEIEETLDDGTKVSRLRAYGSMTYAGFKSYVYAQLQRDDTRVTSALGWIKRNYTLNENPGAGSDGQYYYYLTFARALDAWGEPTIQTLKPDGSAGDERLWAKDLINKLAELQNADGSFKSVDDRWMENNPVLITAYSLIALGHALD